MKNLFKIIIFLLAIWFLWHQFRDVIVTRGAPILTQVISRLNIVSPCEEPITYTIGAFDTRFGISKSYFLKALADAEAIWEKPSSRDLFQYDENGDLTVNLVYDYRQQATNKLKSLGIEVKETRASYDALKAEFIALKDEYEKAKASFNAEIAAFNQRQAAYEEKVKYWNSRGGAPEREYKELQAEKSALDAEAAQLKIRQDNINAMVDEINALVVVLNSLAAKLNISVDKYNTVGASRGDSFEEGIYESGGINQKIDIYEFSSRDKLLRVLAHEFGHALDLPHVEDPKAIMYKLNQGSSKTLAEADLAALNDKCGE